jgi:hypothetical protein
MNKHPAEGIAELMGDPMPADWQDEVALQARRDHLAALAYSAAELGLECVVNYAERGELSTDARDAFVGAVLALDKGWRKYVAETGRSASAVVREALRFWVGELLAGFVEAVLDQVWAEQRAIIQERVGLGDVPIKGIVR